MTFPLVLIPFLFPLVFLLFWAFVCSLIALCSGWSTLGKKYRTRHLPQGERFRFVSGIMGYHFMPTSYRSTLNVTVSESGLGLQVMFLFRFFSPNLLLPWEELEVVKDQPRLGRDCTKITIRDSKIRISLYGDVAERIENEFFIFKANREL